MRYAVVEGSRAYLETGECSAAMPVLITVAVLVDEYENEVAALAAALELVQGFESVKCTSSYFFEK